MQRTASSARCTPLATTGRPLRPASQPTSSGVRAGSNSRVTTAMKPPSWARAVLSPVRLGRDRSWGRCTPLRSSRRRSPETGASTVRTRAPYPCAAVRWTRSSGAGPIAEDVDLHPSGSPGCRRGHVLQRTGGERGQDHERAHLGRTRGPSSFSPSGWAKPWMAVGAITTGERTGWPRSVVDGGDLVDPGQHPRVELPTAPGRHVLGQESLVLCSTREVGVGHFPDDPAGVPLQIDQREVNGQGGRTGRTEGAGRRVVSRPVAAGRMIGHRPHGRRRPRSHPTSIPPEVTCDSRMPSQ